MYENNVVIGAGYTGIGVGMTPGFKIFEANDYPGSICTSYQKEGFRFDMGGGHWIFGGDRYILELMNKSSKCKKYTRNSAVFFTGSLNATRLMERQFVNYPIQNNLYAFGEKIAKSAVKEIVACNRTNNGSYTMAEWLKFNFGETLYEIFFGPFHERYTAGLNREIAPQDPYKTPFDIKNVISGATGNARMDVGYNATFVYPENGLSVLSRNLAKNCNIQYGARAEKINIKDKTIKFCDGSEVKYKKLISTLPLNKILRTTGLSDACEPFVSVLVLNMGVEFPANDIAKHHYHWLYVPDSITGFHRIGYYSNVDQIFLPEKMRNLQKFGSIYIEFAFRGGERPSGDRIKKLITNTEAELKSLGLIKKAIVVDSTWIEVAYTWKKPNSNWVNDVISNLAKFDILSIGRYGRWSFQGIAESLKEGILEGAAEFKKQREDNQNDLSGSLLSREDFYK